MARKLDFPVFDADNHFYETTDAFTRYLPKEYAGTIKYVQVSGRTKLAIRNVISDYIPNPTFEVVAPPGAFELQYKLENPNSVTKPGDKPKRSPAEFAPTSRHARRIATARTSTRSPTPASTSRRSACATPSTRRTSASRRKSSEARSEGRADGQGE